ncbi:MAG: DNA alkylation repair protein [Acidobacteria bacterium]|nr:DNA alkylation repair protein [Acidobacteriota bacterium]
MAATDRHHRPDRSQGRHRRDAALRCLRGATPRIRVLHQQGWALREYAKTKPDEVRAFAVDNRDDMSGLSFREATKHLDL